MCRVAEREIDDDRHTDDGTEELEHQRVKVVNLLGEENDRDMVPAPVVSGIEIGITAREIILEKEYLPSFTTTCWVEFIIFKPVLRRRSPPAIRNAWMLMSKKPSMDMPAIMAVIMVMKEVIVAMAESLCCSFGARAPRKVQGKKESPGCCWRRR